LIISSKEEFMKWHKFVLGGIAGAALGAAAIHGLHAQAKPPAYLVIEIDVTNPDLYKQYLAKNAPLTAQFGGRFIARGGRVDAFAGDPPKRAVIAIFDNIEKAQAFRDSPEYRELIPLRDQAAKYRAYITEGLAN
jgi:uncharacterized protein (DUF1330 family)